MVPQVEFYYMSELASNNDEVRHSDIDAPATAEWSLQDSDQRFSNHEARHLERSSTTH